MSMPARHVKPIAALLLAAAVSVGSMGGSAFASPARHKPTVASLKAQIAKLQRELAADEAELAKMEKPKTSAKVTPTVGGPAVPVSEAGQSYNVAVSQYVVEPGSYDPPGDTDGFEVAQSGQHYEAYCLTVTNTGSKTEDGNPEMDTQTVSTTGQDNVQDPAIGNVALTNCPPESGTGWTLSPGQTTSMGITVAMPDGQNLHTLTFSANAGLSLGGNHSATWTLTP